MKFSYTLLIFLIVSFASYVQAQKITASDSIKSRLGIIEKNFKEVKHYRDSLKRYNDSLTRELLYYKVKDDYYASAVDRQGSHFEFMLSILFTALAIVAGFSFKSIFDTIQSSSNNTKENIQKVADGINLKIDYLDQAVSKELTSHISMIEKVDSQLDNVTMRIHSEFALEAINQGFHFFNRKDPVIALDYGLKSIEHALKIYRIAILHPKEHKHPDFEIEQRIGEATFFLDECIKVIEDPEIGDSTKRMIDALISSYVIVELLEVPNLKSRKVVLNFMDKLSKLKEDSDQKIVFPKN